MFFEIDLNLWILSFEFTQFYTVNEQINEKISVITSFNRETGIVIPKKIRWQGRDYLINKLTYYHRARIGRVLLHIFHVTDGVLDFCLQLNSENLNWILEEICDGNPN